MANSTESIPEANEALTARRPKRFGWLALCAVALGAFWTGGVVHSRMAKPFEASLLAAFPEMMELNSPVTIQVNWDARVKQEISSKFDLKVYAGPAKYTVKNKSKRSIKMVFPPQSCFHFRLKDLGTEMQPRKQEDIPEWARKSFVLSLQPGEERRFDDAYAMTTSRAPGEYEYGPLAFDFAAPSDTDPTEYVTGTVLCSMKASITK